LVPAFVRVCRDASFDVDGVALTSDRARREGLRLVSGSAGRVGARYRVVPAGAAEDGSEEAGESGSADEQDEPTGEEVPVYAVDLLADDQTALRIGVAGSVDHTRSIVELTDPGRPSRAHFDFTARGRGCLTGPYVATATADVNLAALTSDGRRPQAVGKLARPRYEIGARVRVSRQADNGSQIELTLIVRGRGLLRPVVAVALMGFKRFLNRGLHNGLARFGRLVESFADSVRARHGARPNPEDAARMLLDELLGAVVESVPAHLPGDDGLPD
jgi:hypothetical protein